MRNKVVYAGSNAVFTQRITYKTAGMDKVGVLLERDSRGNLFRLICSSSKFHM